MRMLIPALALAALAGCGSDAGISSKDGALDGDFDTDDGWGDTAFPGGEPDFDSDLPPEEEVENLFLAPTQTDVYLFIANPLRDTVTRIEVRNLDVITTEVGRTPRVVAITDDYATAVVFNQGDATVSILDADTLDQVVVPVRGNLNAMLLSPDGAYAVLWHDRDAVRPDDPPPSGAESFNEISLVDVASGTHTPLVVGFNPKDVTFTPDGTLALVVADASMAAIRLDEGTPTPEFIEVADPLDPPPAEEVVVDPAGRYAFVRQFGRDEIQIVDLETRIPTAVPVGANPTDLDLTPDGTRAVVVSRGAGEVAVFDVADPFAPPEVVPFVDETPLGSVILGEDGVGILYSTATAIARYATWDLATGEIRMRPLAKPAKAVARTPTGGSLLVVHDTTDASDGSTPEVYRGRHAISLISLTDFRANTLALAAEPLSFANADNGRLGYVVMEGQPYLEVLDYTSLIFEEVRLSSLPVFLGVLPDLDPADADEPAAWISQEHPLGRLSFYDPETTRLDTLTGFELNDRIED